jgi:tetratricopeptide (TPR) repeat protein
LEPVQVERTSIAQDNPPAGGRPQRRHDALYYSILISVAVLPYLNTLGNGFVYDDNFQIVANPYLRSFHYLKQIIFTPVWSFKYAQVSTNYYRPLMPLQYLLMFKVYGPLAYPYHLANVLMHAGVVVLLFAVTRRLFGSARLAFLAAALFAVHPIHTEVVAWIAAVPDLQLALFLLVTLWLYMDLDDPARRKWWTSTAMCGVFFLALFSKEPAIAFPLIMTIYEHFLRPNRNATFWTQKFSRYFPLWALTAVYLGARVILMGGLVPRIQHPRVSWYSTLLSAVALFGKYMGKLIWPARMMVFYPVSFATSLRDPSFLYGAAWLIGLFLLCYGFWKRDRLQIFSVIWLAAMLAPALNSRWMPGNVFAERYLYVPSMGFCWLVAYGALKVWDAGSVRRHAWLRATALTAAIATCLLFAFRTETRNAVWRSNLTLFKDSVDKNPAASDLRSDLGSAYWAEHNRSAAMEQWNIALSINPDSFWALNNLGIAALDDKRYTDAVALLYRAVALSPHFTDAHVNLAEALARLGQNDDAQKQFQAAILNSPLDWDAQNRLAGFYHQTGRVEDAEKQYLVSLNVQVNAVAFDGLGDIALERGQTDLAEKYFRQAADLDPYDRRSHYNLAIIYGTSGRVEEALHEYKLGQQTDLGTDKLSQDARAVIEKLQKR